MSWNRNQAMRTLNLAEAKFAERNYIFAKALAQEAQSLCPDEMAGISKFLAVVDVFISAEVKIGALTDWYYVLGVSPTSDAKTIRNRFREMALSIHPDKNSSTGSGEAFTIICRANDVLSNEKKRSDYDEKRRLNLLGEKNYDDQSELSP